MRLIRNTICRALFLLVLAGSSGVAQKMVPDAPVKNFKLPMFGEDGYKKWDIQGKEGKYISAEQLDVIAMILRLFASGDPIEPQTVIESPSATIYPKLSEAAGKEAIFITERGGNYSIYGRDWRWNGQKDTITIKRDARVTFRQSLGSIIE